MVVWLRADKSGFRRSFERLLTSLRFDAGAGSGGAPSFHVWLPIADQGSPAGLVAKVALKGVSLAPPTYVAPGRASTFGIRLCLGAPQSIKDLQFALTTVAEAVSSDEPLATL